MRILGASVQTFVYATEDIEKVLNCLKNILADFTPTIERSYGHFGNPIDIITISFGRKEAEQLLNQILNNLSLTERKKISGEIEKRFQDGNFYLRLDKMKACDETISLGEGIQITFKITTYPFNRKKIIEELKQTFS